VMSISAAHRGWAPRQQ